MEQQLDLLQDDARDVSWKRPAARSGVKRPAAAFAKAEAVGGERLSLRVPILPKGKARARAVAKSMAGAKGSKVAAIAKAMPKKIAKAKPKGKAKAKATAKAAPRTRAAREAVRQAVLKKVPKSLKIRYRHGCQKCRGRALCTPSCWAERGFYP